MNEWHYMSKEKPEPGWYLVAVPEADGVQIYMDGFFGAAGGFWLNCGDSVIAWMPLPEPPEVEA